MMNLQFEFLCFLATPAANYCRGQRLSNAFRHHSAASRANSGVYSIHRTSPASTHAPVCNSTTRATYDTTTNALNASHGRLNSTHASATIHVTYHGCTVVLSKSTAPATVMAARDG